MALLRLSNIKKSFGAVRALKGVSLELQAGEVHALLGENGAGKSTLIKVITGAHQPDAGEIFIDDKSVASISPAAAHRLGVAAIYQQPALFPDLSVAENIGLAVERSGIFGRVDWAARWQRAAELLEKVGARIDPQTEVRNLSMPEQQLVEISKALAVGARILILDEPTASLTGREVDLLLNLMRTLRHEGTGIIYITHRLPEVFQIADRLTVLRDGESVATRPVSTERRSTKGETKERTDTREGGPVTEVELIRLMVGREISAIFPPSESQPTDVVLRVDGLGCRTSGIRNVSFELRRGEVLGLAGLVGAGRTELARILFGVTPADTGTILLEGKEVRIGSPQDAIRAGISYVPEDRRRHGVIPEMPIASNMTMAVHPRLFPGGWLRFAREKELAEKYTGELAVKTPSVTTRAGNLSGGNQQKVALARWLATNPKVLILDEPTQGVDVGAKAEIHKLIRKFAAQGLAVLMISSELPEILGMSDRIVVMRHGTIAATLDSKSTAEAVISAAVGSVIE
jgi:rhamnose transport system ATP-binding protein